MRKRLKDPFLHGRTTLGERGQIVIPQSIRNALGVKPGEEMIVVSRGQKIVVFPAKNLESWYESLIGKMDILRKGSRKS